MFAENVQKTDIFAFDKKNLLIPRLTLGNLSLAYTGEDVNEVRRFTKKKQDSECLIMLNLF